MNPRHNTIVLAGAAKKFDLQNGQIVSKLEFDVAGVGLINRILSSIPSGNTHLVISEEELLRIELPQEIDICRVGATSGALITALIGIKDCDLSLPLVICPGDSLLTDGKLQEFIEQSDASDSEISIIVFNSEKPNYSYIRPGGDLWRDVA